MGSALAPIIAKFYVEHFEQKAISTATKKPARWYRYVDDIFMVWPHGKDDPQGFLQQLNNIRKSIDLRRRLNRTETYRS
jgi:hypothetical protein